ncbi:hypothetical protein MKZ38_010111 [Zalerion maritima]|uniref:Uncharacterized protein n=1 Tax=Zalerion maritima TaxID=339359 RepID=A0AAD5S0Y4_9PEZI|nr:hypothetical protein MKZ38_010111 [Zalerion maritima]
MSTKVFAPCGVPPVLVSEEGSTGGVQTTLPSLWSELENFTLSRSSSGNLGQEQGSPEGSVRVVLNHIQQKGARANQSATAAMGMNFFACAVRGRPLLLLLFPSFLPPFLSSPFQPHPTSCASAAVPVAFARDLDCVTAKTRIRQFSRWLSLTAGPKKAELRMAPVNQFHQHNAHWIG